MWNKLTGKDSDVASSSSKRRSTSDRGDRERRERRAESIVTSSSSRAPPSSSREDREERRVPRSSTFPLEEQRSGASSYATAPSERQADSDTTSRRSHRRDKEKREEKTQYRVSERGVERVRGDSPSPERRKSSSKRDSSRERDKSKEERREQRRRERARADTDDNGSSSYRKSRSKADQESTRGPEDFPSQISGAGFSQFPGQDGGSGLMGPSQTSHSTSDAHVANQFPGQQPAYTWHDAKAVSEGGVGLAAEYYGDQGQSVGAQPGFRTHSPNMLVNPDAHLISASATANPAQDTGNGAAADFYDGKISPVPFAQTTSSSSSKPTKPGKKPSGSGSSLAGVAALAGTAAAGYALSQGSGHKPSKTNGGSSSIYQQGTNVSMTSSYHSESAPALPTMSNFSEAGPSNSRPGKHSSGSNAAAYAAGAAALGAAGAYALHEHHEHEHNKLNSHGSRPSNSNGRPSRPMYNMSDGSFVMNQYGGGPNGMMMEHKHRGPVSRLVDWWKDHEDVRKMEAYTQEIGVCRYCFDPQTSVYDAPRKHHYNRRKRSKESLVSGRVEKQSRYGYVSDEDKGWGMGKWIGAGLAGYGVAKVGKKILGNDRDFDDTYSVKTGRRMSDMNDSRISLVSRGSRRGSDSDGRRRSYSRQSDGVVRHKSGRRSDASMISVDVHGDGSKDYASVRRKKSHRSGSRSSSGSRRGSKAGLVGAGLGLAAGAAAAHEYGKHRRQSRSRSPAVKVRHKNRSRSRSSERTHRRRSSHSKKKGGFFTWGNDSSSSTDSALAYGFNAPRRKSSVKSMRSTTLASSARNGQRKAKHKSSDEKLNATLAGLAATGAAITAVQAAKRGRRHNADLIAVKEKKGQKRANDSLLGVPGKRSSRAHRRTRSGASNDSSSSSSLSIASWRDETAVDDDGWEDESDIGAEDLPSSASSDDGLSGLAYGEDVWGSRKARKSTDSLVSNASGTDKWLWRWGGKKKSKRRSSDIEAKQSSGLGTAATMAGALAAGAAVAAVSEKRKDDRKSVQFEQRPPPTPLSRKQDAPSEASSVSGSMHTVYPTATSDPYKFDAVTKHGSTPTRSNTFPLQQAETTVYTSRPEIKQPQPLSKVRDSVYTTQPDYQPSYTATAGPPSFSNYDIKQPFHSLRRESYPVSPGGADLMKDVAIGAAAAAATGGVIPALSKDGSDKEARRRRREDDEAYAERVRRKGKEEASEIRSRQKREVEDMERLRRASDKRSDQEQRATDAAKDAESRRQQYDREMAARAEIARQDQEAKDAFEAERKAHYESERAARNARRAEEELAKAERLARDAVLADHERSKGTSEADRGASARESLHDERADDRSSWTAPVAAGVGAAVAGAVVAEMISDRGDRSKDKEEATRDIPAVMPVITPEHVIAVTPSKVVIDMDDNKDVEDALNDPDFFTKMAAKRREVSDHVSPSNNPVYTPIARPRSRSEVIRDFDDRYKDVKETVNNEEFWAPEELKQRTGQGAQVEESEAKRDGPNADVIFDSYPGSVNPPYEPSYSFDVRDAHGGARAPGRLDWVPRLNLIPPTPPPSSPAQGPKRDDLADTVGGAEREPVERKDRSEASRSVQHVEEITPSQQAQPSAQSHSIGEVYVREPEDPPTPPSAARKPASSRVSFGGSEIHNYEVPSPEPSVLEGHEGHFPKLDLNERAEGSSVRDITDPTADQSSSYKKSKAGDDVETPVEEELVTEGAAHLAESARDSPYFPHEPEEYDRGQKRKESETPIYESVSPERTPVYEEPREHDSFYQQPYYDTVSDIGLAGEAPRRPGFVIGEVETPGNEKKDPISTEKEMAAEETEARYMPSMPGAFDDEAAPSTSREAPVASQPADESETTPADDVDEFAGLSKKERKKAEKAKARRLAELAATGAAGAAAAAVLVRDAPESPADKEAERASTEADWSEEPKRSKKKSKSKSKTNGDKSYDEPAAQSGDNDADLPRGRYDYEELERKELTREGSDIDYDEGTARPKRKSRDRGSDDSPAPSVKSEGYDEHKKTKRRSHKSEADEFIDEEYSRQVSTSEPGYREREAEDEDKPKRKKSSRRSGDDFDDAASAVSSRSKYDDDDERKSKKEKKRSSLASIASSLIGGNNDSPSSRKDRDGDGTSEISSRSRSSRNDDDDDDRRTKRKKEKRKSRSEVDEDESFLGDRAEENKMAPLPHTTVAAAGPAPVSMPSIEPEPVSGERQEREVILPDVGSEAWKEAMEKLANEAPHDEASEAAAIELPKSLPPSPTPEEKTFEAGLLADLQSSLARQRGESTASVATAISKPTPPRPAPIITSRTFSPTSVPVRFRRPPLSGHGRSNSVEPEDYRIQNNDTAMSSPLAETSTRSTPRHAKTFSAESPASASFRVNTQEMRPLYLVERNRYRNSWSGPDSSALGRDLENLPSLPSSRASSELGSEEDVKREISTPGWEDAVAGGAEDDFFSAHGTPEWRAQDSFSAHGTPERSTGDFFSAHGTPERPEPEDDWLDSQQATPRATHFDPNVFNRYDASQIDDPRSGLANEDSVIEPTGVLHDEAHEERSRGPDPEHAKGHGSDIHAAVTAALVGGTAGYIASEVLTHERDGEDDRKPEAAEPFVRLEATEPAKIDEDPRTESEARELRQQETDSADASGVSDPLLRRTSAAKDKKQSKGKKKGKKGKSSDARFSTDTATDSFTESTSTPTETADDAVEAPLSRKASKKKGKKARKAAEAWVDDEAPESSRDVPDTESIPREDIPADVTRSLTDEIDQQPGIAEAQTEAGVTGESSRGLVDVATPTVEKEDPFSSATIPQLAEPGTPERPTLPHALTAPTMFAAPLVGEGEELQDAQSRPQPVVHDWEEPLEDSLIEDGQQKGFIIEHPDVGEPLEESFIEDGQQKGFILPESIPLPEDDMDLAELEEQIEVLDEQLHPDGSQREGSPVSVRIPEGQSIKTFEPETGIYPAAVVPHSLTHFINTRSKASELEDNRELSPSVAEPREADVEDEDLGPPTDKEALRDILHTMSQERVTERDALEELKQRVSADRSAGTDETSGDRDQQAESIPQAPEEAFNQPSEEIDEPIETEAWQPQSKKKKGKKGKRGAAAAAAAAATMLGGASAMAMLEREEAPEDMADADKATAPTVEDISTTEGTAEASIPAQDNGTGPTTGDLTVDTAPDEPVSQSTTEVPSEQPTEADDTEFQVPTKKSKKDKRKEKKKKGKAADPVDAEVEAPASRQEDAALREIDSQPTGPTATTGPASFEEAPREQLEAAHQAPAALKQEDELPQPVKKSKKEKRKDKKKAQAFDWDQPSEDQQPDEPESDPQVRAVTEPDAASPKDESNDTTLSSDPLPNETRSPMTGDGEDGGYVHHEHSADTGQSTGMTAAELIGASTHASTAPEPDNLKPDTASSSIAGPVESQNVDFADNDRTVPSVVVENTDRPRLDTAATTMSMASRDQTRDFIYGDLSHADQSPGTRDEYHHDEASPDETRNFIYGPVDDTRQQTTAHQERSVELTNPFLEATATHQPDSEKVSPKTNIDTQDGESATPSDIPLPPSEDEAMNEAPSGHVLSTAWANATQEEEAAAEETGVSRQVESPHEYDESLTKLASERTAHGREVAMPDYADGIEMEEPDRTLHTTDALRSPKDDEDLSAPADVDFTATLAAGLEDSGMDPNIVLRDSSYYRKSSSPPAEREILEDEYSPPARNRRKGRASRTPSVQSLRAGSQEPPQLTTTTEPEGTFDAALAMGLTGAGFDAAKVMEEASSSGRQSPRDLDPEPTFTLSKRKKKGKKGRRDADNEAPSWSEPAAELETLAANVKTESSADPGVSAQQATIEAPELTKDAQAPFEAPGVLPRAQDEALDDTTPAADDQEWAVPTKKQKKKKGKKGRVEESATPTAEEEIQSVPESQPLANESGDSATKDQLQAIEDKSINDGNTPNAEEDIPETGEEAEPIEESTWTTPSKSKGKKGKKGKKGTTSAASSRAPAGILAAAATSLMLADDAAPSSSSKKSSKKGKKGKETPMLSTDDEPNDSTTPPVMQPDTGGIEATSDIQVEQLRALEEEAAARKIQHAWRVHHRDPAISNDRSVAAKSVSDTDLDQHSHDLQPEDAARRIQSAWRPREQRQSTERALQGAAEEPIEMDEQMPALTDEAAARRIQKAWRKRPRQIINAGQRPKPQHRESTYTEFEEDLDDDDHDNAAPAVIAGTVAAAGALAAHSMLKEETERETGSPEPLSRPRSAQDITAAYEQTWSFPANRDSAIQVSPTIPQSARRSNARDSGFHESPPTPSSKRGRDREETIGASAGSPILTGTTTSSADPLRVSVEVAPDWELQMSTPSKQAIPAGQSQPIESSRELSGIDEVVSPLQSATKPRTSELFNSSPSTREFATPEAPHRQPPPLPHDTATRGQHDFETRNSDHVSSRALDTIAEHAAEPSPLAKKGRRLSDVGTPEHAVKALRRTDSTEEAHPDDHTTREILPLPRLGTGQHAATSASMDELIARKSWPPLDEESETVDLDRGQQRSLDQRSSHEASSPGQGVGVKQRHDRVMSPVDRVRSPSMRSPSVLSDRSNGSLSRFRTPEHGHQRTLSTSSQGSPHSLRRVDRSASGDLRAKSRAEAGSAKSPLGPTSPLRDEEQQLSATLGFEPQPGARALDKGKGRALDMGDTFEAMGEARGSSMSPSRPPSLRKRQSNHIMDLESKVEQFTSENRQLQDRLAKAQHEAQLASQQLEVHATSVRTATDDIRARDLQLSEKDAEIAQARATLQSLQDQLARLQEENEELQGSHRGLAEDAEGKYAALEAEHARTYQSWQESSRDLDELRDKHQELSGGMEELVHQEIALALADRNEEIKRLNEELESAMGQIKMLQQQILDSKQGESFLSVRDEDYFDSACQQLCQHVQQWVLKFSKFSDGRPCRLSSDLDKIRDLTPSEREKLEDRLDNAVLDGSDVDQLLADRVSRRDVFMSLVMSMLWEHVFTRFLFGMDRDQRQKLKNLEKTLAEIGPKRAVAQWRAITLTLLAKRPSFQSQRADDTEAVMWAIYNALSTLLPPPKALEAQVQDQLKKVIRLAVDLSIEMRTQRAEYLMLQPLQPEYDMNGDLVQKVPFNAALMNERSGDKEVSNNEEWEQRGAFVKIMLFPLVVKKGDDLGEGDDEVVICPAQVLVAKPKKGKNVRVLSGAVEMDPRRSMQSVMPPDSVDMSAI